jgi:hypothetical protein
MILHIIVAAYQHPVATRGLIDSFVVQTSKCWKLYCVHDGPPYPEWQDHKRLYENEPRVGLFSSDVQFGCNGHLNRSMFLDALTGNPDDFILITNCDNYYIPVFVEYMLRECKSDVGIVYCNTLHSHQDYAVQVSTLKLSGIDMGAFIVRLSVAQENRFNHVEYMAADGLFAEETAALCAQKGLRTVHVNKALFIHN